MNGIINDSFNIIKVFSYRMFLISSVKIKGGFNESSN